MKLKKLLAKYPTIFSKGDYSIPDAWIPIVDRLCLNLVLYVSLYEVANDEAIDFHCLQMKEKFGELRFYVNTDNDIISTLIDYASYQSRSICQKCGSRYNINVYGPWISYLCDEHAPKEDKAAIYSEEALEAS
jgi:hypothetical protein